MAVSAVFVDRDDLVARRRRFLAQTRLTWDEMSVRAESWELSDDEQDIFHTVRGIDRMLAALDDAE